MNVASCKQLQENTLFIMQEMYFKLLLIFYFVVTFKQNFRVLLV